MAWLEAFHIMSVITWFAGIFYLPRLFVYHAMSDDQISKDRFVVMERKLFKGIMTPSAIATVLFGSWLIASAPDYYLRQGWLHAKLTLVALLIIYHISCWWFMVRFREDRNTHSHKFFRFYNEAPVLVMIAVVILVVVKPF
jgi:protoporphyrinogen IX oxidase